MDTQIGGFDPDTKSVPVTFTAGEIVYERRVNACLDEHGGYDAEATATRVAQVAQGVAVKIGLGVVKAAPPETHDEPIAEPAAEPSPAA